MGRDITYEGTLSEATGLTKYVSGWNVTETAGAAAYVKLRDSIVLPTVCSAVDGAAGNSTAGLHMYAITFVTRHGESLMGPRVEATSAGSTHVTVTIPIGPTNLDTRTGGATSGLAPIRDIIVGRRVYATKAGAPATTVTPTIAQWFLTAADLSTTLAAGMNNLPLAGNASITVAATTNFKTTNGNILVTTTSGVQPVSYTSVDATHFLGCAMLRPAQTGAYMATGGAVTQPIVGDNTATTYDLNLADASFTATNPPIKDTAGKRIITAKLTAGQSVGDSFGGNVIGLANGGGLYFEVNSGTVEYTGTGL